METFSAIILAGGQSRRFGLPKADAQFRGRPMLEWVIEAASSVAREVIVVCAPGQALPGLVATAGVLTVEDDSPFDGPLAGLRTGLRLVTGDWAFGLACDMPLLTSDVLAALAGHRNDDVDAVVPRIDGRLQPLAALYRRAAAIAAFEEAWHRGERSVRSALDRLRVVEVGPGAFGSDASTLLAFRSANTAAELAALEAKSDADAGAEH